MGTLELHSHSVVDVDKARADAKKEKSSGEEEPRVFWDVSCPLPSHLLPLSSSIRPLASLSHTHSLGRWASLWLVQGGQWVKLGAADPRVRIKSM